MTDPVLVTVPLFDEALEPPPSNRVRALKRHLVRSLHNLRAARRPERLIQKAPPEPAGFAAEVVAAGCATCRGHCCKGGGDHAYIDERTMARVRRDHPDLDARAIIRLYLDRIAPRSWRGSCLFHGEAGCTLGRGLRATLCDAYYCNGLRDFLNHAEDLEHVQIAAARNGVVGRSAVVSRAGSSSSDE